MKFHEELNDIFIEIELIDLLEKYYYCFVDFYDFELERCWSTAIDEDEIKCVCTQLLNSNNVHKLKYSFYQFNGTHIAFNYVDDSECGSTWEISDNIINTSRIIKYEPVNLLRRIVNKYFSKKTNKFILYQKEILNYLNKL